jgi:hypothetical protein
VRSHDVDNDWLFHDSMHCDTIGGTMLVFVALTAGFISLYGYKTYCLVRDNSIQYTSSNATLNSPGAAGTPNNNNDANGRPFSSGGPGNTLTTAAGRSSRATGQPNANTMLDPWKVL